MTYTSLMRTGPEKDKSGIWKQWGIEQSSELARRAVAEAAIDLIDASSGGLWAAQKIPVGPSYQVPLAESIKKANPNVLVTAVGLITNVRQAEDIVKDAAKGGNGLDAIWLAREFLRNADFVLKAAEELGVVVRPVVQYERGWTRLLQ
jgi:2,4-dienoyl-CoA reductase-like NADH-dependent reductase (Old Yellow Enzyme family)